MIEYKSIGLIMDLLNRDENDFATNLLRKFYQELQILKKDSKTSFMQEK